MTCLLVMVLQASLYGGAVYADANDGLLLLNTTIKHNTAGLAGGGIYFTSQNYPRLHVNLSSITGNTVRSSLVPAGYTQADTDSAGAGGGIAALGSIQFALNNTRLHKNAAASHGGGAYCRGCMNVELVQSTVSSNTATASGGGLTLERLLGKSLISRSVFADNICKPADTAVSADLETLAAAVANASTSAGAQAGCTASSGGGGLCAQVMAGVLELSDVVVGNNTAVFGGQCYS